MADGKDSFLWPTSKAPKDFSPSQILCAAEHLWPWLRRNWSGELSAFSGKDISTLEWTDLHPGSFPYQDALAAAKAALDIEDL